MLTRRLFAALILSAVLCASSATAAETLETVEAKIVALWEKVDAFTADFEMTANQTQGSMTTQSKGKGKVECLKRDGKALSRLEITNTIEMAGQTIKQKILTVFDGTTVFIETDMMGQRMVMKQKPGAGSGADAQGGKAMFNQLRATGKLELLPDETVAGKKAYVIGITMKPGSPPGSPAKGRLAISKDTGLALQMTFLDAAGKTVMSQIYKNHKLNPKLDPDRFKYTPPPGVQVMDMANMPRPPGM